MGQGGASPVLTEADKAEDRAGEDMCEAVVSGVDRFMGSGWLSLSLDPMACALWLNSCCTRAAITGRVKQHQHQALGNALKSA